VVAGSAQAQQSNQSIIDESRETISESEARIRASEQQRKDLRDVAATATSQLDIDLATADDLVAALDAVRASVNAQHEAWANAERLLLAAEAALRDAEAEIAILEAKIEFAKERLYDSLVESYVTLQTPQGSLNLLSDDPWELAHQQALAGFATGNRIDHIDELRRLGGEREHWRQIVEEAKDAAEHQREHEEELLLELEAAQDMELHLVLDAQDRVERRLYEVQTLQAFDVELAADIEREERRIADALSRQRSAEAAQQRALEEERRRRAQAQTAPVTPAGEDFTLVWVRGIQVNTSIADGLERLLDAMQDEGYELAGWGYRTHQAQISLRKAHCGTSDYAVWQMPSHHCSPPTARPGRSNHETGEAVDFTVNGSVISSRSTAVFQALSRLAPQFGLHNLPSEPWHWSVDGR